MDNKTTAPSHEIAWGCISDLCDTCFTGLEFERTNIGYIAIRVIPRFIVIVSE